MNGKEVKEEKKTKKAEEAVKNESAKVELKTSQCKVPPPPKIQQS